MHAQEQVEEEEVVIRMLQIARATVHNERVLEHDAHEFQSKLAHFKILIPTANLLDSHNELIVEEALLLLSEVLDEGNDDAQARFLHHFHKNHDESFFFHIHTIITDLMEEMEEMRNLAKQTQLEKERTEKLTGTMTMAAKMGAHVTKVYSLYIIRIFILFMLITGD